MCEFKPNGELYFRAFKNYLRLNDGLYHFWKKDTSGDGWPGDFEGRLLLGLICQAETTGKEPLYLKRLCDCVFNRTSDLGYFGHSFDQNSIDEQQLSGNSWFLRAMVALYNHNGDKRALNAIRRTVEGLFLVCHGKYAEYPLERTSGKKGKESGERDRLIGRWLCSTDIGCAYIPLDGVTAAYGLLRSVNDPLCFPLAGLIDEMIENYFRLDFSGMKVQTHATLSGLRGILRYATLTGKTELIAKAEKIFALYVSDGMTLTYENKNWFGRPEWTEPCAIIDSFAVASELFALTGGTEYEELAHRIYFNGICASQRENGGFGCDSCVGGDEKSLYIKCYEATWCCTMRGGEGFSYVIKNAVTERLGSVYINIPFSGEYVTERGSVKITTDYPYTGSVDIVPEVGFEQPVFLFVPSFARGITVNGRPAVPENGFIRVSGSASVRFGIPLQNDNGRLSHGCLVLCGKEPISGSYVLSDDSSAEYSDGEKLLFPVKDAFYPLEKEDAGKARYFVIAENQAVVKGV